MNDRPNPVSRRSDEIVLTGTMVVYDSQGAASAGIPGQWREFLDRHPALRGSARLCGASPCTSDGKIHYMAGVVQEGSGDEVDGERLVLEAGEYAVVRVDDAALLRDTWVWLLGTWLAGSGRRERRAPEFERYAGVGEDGTPVGAVEIWIPLEPLVGGGGVSALH